MCGITGIFDLGGRMDICRPLLEAMNRAQEHRGPDGEGYHVEPGVGLGHRRLSIIDLEGGHQPLFNEDGSIAVTYNGEIYNFKEIRAELEASGHVFRTRCDTEIIVHGWEEWGEACVERFNGMFAFGIWDRNRDCVFLARDRIGIKPLYYAVTTDNSLIFATELKALTLHPGLDRALRPEAIEDYFGFGYVPDPKTIFASASKLPPGHTLLVRRGHDIPEPRQYWDLEFNTGGPIDSAALDEQLISRLTASVDRRLIAEVPLGAFLSGGVDSSAVVALMSQLSADPVNTCSISFGDSTFNESRYADQVAGRYSTNHKTRQVDPADYSLVDILPGLYDEPFADSSAMPTYRVCELARETVTVALSGDGGDENFLGYHRYRWHSNEERVRRWLPQAIRGPMFNTLGTLYPNFTRAPKFLRAKATLLELSKNSLEAYFSSVSILPAALRQELFSPQFRSELDGYESLQVYQDHAENARVEDALQLVQYLDFKTYLPGDILTKVDRASMAHGLEVRVPLLDHTFVEWVATLPTGEKLDGAEGKACFKRALEPYLPHDIMYRPKMGFSVPIGSWFRHELRDKLRDLARSERLQASGIFDLETVGRLVNEHQAEARNHSQALWALAMFDGFLATLERTKPFPRQPASLASSE
jgi:asparagine synthase (glutamine-hydrolysing)